MHLYTLVLKAASYVVFAYPIHFFWWSNLARIGNKNKLHPDQEGNGPRSSLHHGPELKRCNTVAEDSTNNKCADVGWTSPE